MREDQRRVVWRRDGQEALKVHFEQYPSFRPTLTSIKWYQALKGWTANLGDWYICSHYFLDERALILNLTLG
jgi:hypothetical protein